MKTRIAQKLAIVLVFLFTVANAFAGTSVLDFSEFKTAAVKDWNLSNYADHMANTPAIVSEVLTSKGDLDVRLIMADENAVFAGPRSSKFTQVGFEYPVCVLASRPYPQADSNDLRANPYMQHFRFTVDKSVNAEALVSIESFDLLSNPGTVQGAGLQLWIENSKGHAVWGPVVVSPYSARNGRIWPQRMPSDIKADSQMTLWIKDMDSYGLQNFKEKFWAIDNLKFRQIDKSEQSDAEDYTLTNIGKKSKHRVERGMLNPARFEVAHLPTKKQLVIAVSAVNKLGKLDKLVAKFSVTAKDSAKEVVSGQIDNFDDLVVAKVVDISTCEPGDYTVTVQLFESGKLFDSLSDPLLIKPLPAWLGNQIGILPENMVPEPWTNIKATSGWFGSKDISFWNRRFSYNKGLQPEKIKTAGKQILSRPVQMTAKVNDVQSTTATPGKVRYTKKTNSRVELATSGKLGDLETSTETWVEYDGFMWIKLTLSPKEKTTITDLKLEIPVKREFATLYNSDLEDDHFQIGLIDRDSFFTRFDQIWNKAIQCWIGTEEFGLQWIAESDKNWMLNDPHKGIGYIRKADEVVVTINLIDHKVDLTEPLTYEFGLMATPTRPKPKGWRKWIFGTAQESATGAEATEYGPQGVTHHMGFSYWSTYLRTRYPAAAPNMKERVDLLKEQGVTAVIDNTIIWTNPIGPEYRYFQDEWHPSPWALPDIEKMDPDKQWLEYVTCPKAQSYVDWWLWSTMTRLIEPVELEAIYFDMSMPTMCGNRWHGCGFQDKSRGWPAARGYFSDGYGPYLPYRRLIDQPGYYHPETQLLATREIFKRFYVAARQYDPDFMIVYHSSGDYYMPLASFTTAMYQGEDLRKPPISYYDKLNLPLFRAGYMGHNFGPLIVILPEFYPAATRDRSEKDPERWLKPEPDVIKVIRHLVGMMLVHDTYAGSSASKSTFVPYNDLVAAQREFGQWDDDMKFLPYWNNAQYVEVAPKDDNLVCSIFKGAPAERSVKPRCMFVVFNNNDRDIRTTLTINFAKLKSRGSQLRDLQTEEVFRINNSKVELNMPYRDFRMLLLE